MAARYVCTVLARGWQADGIAGVCRHIRASWNYVAGGVDFELCRLRKIKNPKKEGCGKFFVEGQLYRNVRNIIVWSQ